MRMSIENKSDVSHSEATAADSSKPQVENNDLYGAAHLSRVEEDDEPVLSDVSVNTDQRFV